MRAALDGSGAAGRDQGAAADGGRRHRDVPPRETGRSSDGLDRRRAAVAARVPHGPAAEIARVSELDAGVELIHTDAAFSGFSVNDLAAAKRFYAEILEVEVEEMPQGLRLKIGNGILVYAKENHEPATFTILNFPVDDIDETVQDLKNKGIKFEQDPGVTDHLGIARGIASGRGPDIACFKDPAANIMS